MCFGLLRRIPLPTYPMGNSPSMAVGDVAALAQSPASYTPPLGSPAGSNPSVYFDMQLGRGSKGTPLGRIVMELKVGLFAMDRFLHQCGPLGGALWLYLICGFGYLSFYSCY